MILTGAYERTIDDKNRVQIPAPFRNAMDPDRSGAALFIVPGERENTLSFHPEKHFLDKVASLGTDRIPGPDALEFEQLFFSLACRVELDKQGRVVLPERQLAMVDLGAEVYVTGAHQRIDLWRKSDYERFVQEAGARKSVLQHFLRGGSRPPAESGG